MKVILCDNVAKIGQAGDTKNVSDGFARNFLFPRNLALPVTPANLKWWQSQEKSKKAQIGKDLDSAQSASSELEKITVELKARSGREGHLFGSITNQMIADALTKKGFSIDKKNIILESPIKSLGEYQVSIRLHPQVSAQLKIKIESADSTEQTSEPTAVGAEEN